MFLIGLEDDADESAIIALQNHLSFEFNGNFPLNFADVIDWMLDNLIDKSRTRRGVMKKLKELGLFFAKPSRRREKQNPNWSQELDQELRELYAKYGEGGAPMAHIMEELSDAAKSQRMIVNRLMFLGCIQGKAQVVPQKKKKKTTTATDEDEFEFAQRDDGTTFLRKIQKPVKRDKKKKKKKEKRQKSSNPLRKSKKSFNISTAQQLIHQLTEQGQSGALEWLAEAFEDVSEDLQDEDVDQDDAIPLVPITVDQREAMENEEFKRLLREFGMQEPLEAMVRNLLVPIL